MTRQRTYTIEYNRQIANGVWQMQLCGSTQGFAAGRFVNILVPGFTLRRPLAISSYTDENFTVCYKLVGGGTRELAQQTAGTQLDVLAPLGNGFELVEDSTVLLVGGGAGVAPMLALAKALKQKGCTVRVALGFNKADEIYLQSELEETVNSKLLIPAFDEDKPTICSTSQCAFGNLLQIATVDGSAGQKGLVTGLLPQLANGADVFYCCGPTPMMKAVCESLPDTKGWVSLEERMACGFGGCVGCAIPTRSGMRRVCADGPVFAKEDMLWQ